MTTPKVSRPTMRALLALLLAFPGVSAQQLPYDYTAFIHGFGSSSAMWTTGAPELGYRSPQQYFAASVDLGPVWLPNWNLQTSFDAEWQQVRDQLVSQSGRYVLVGHSNGGLVARYTYLNGGQAARDRIAAILTIATLHQGAILADSAQRLGTFLLDFKRRVEDAKPYVNATVGVVVSVLCTMVGGGPGQCAGWGTGSGLASHFFTNFPVQVPEQLLHAAALPALRTTSPQVLALNGSGNFDASVPRANIVGQLDNNKFTPLKVGAAWDDVSEQSLIDRFQKARTALNVCKHVMLWTLVGASGARKCADAEEMLGRLDETWQRFASGSSPQQQCGQVWYLDGPHYRCWNVMVPRWNIPTDGVVPNERSVYPSQGAGEFWQAPAAIGTNHMTVYRRIAGADKVVEAMLIHLGMRPAGGGGGGSTPSVSITGNGAIAPMVGCSWSASTSGGAPPFTYSWSVNGVPSGGSSESLSYQNTGSDFTIAVTATDQNQQTASAEFFVSIDPSSWCS
ncbi:MAG TPA: alpha/beta hydrolase [Gemmatimonadaceae bacterium]|nr:alpha/beta hydrolase [Gemmatimonadaceae bacterium]